MTFGVREGCSNHYHELFTNRDFFINLIHHHTKIVITFIANLALRRPESELRL